MENKTKVEKDVTVEGKHPNQIAGIGSQIRFQPSGDTGKGKLGIIKSMKSKGITVTVKEVDSKGKTKETDFLINPSQVVKFYAMNDGQA